MSDDGGRRPPQPADARERLARLNAAQRAALERRLRGEALPSDSLSLRRRAGESYPPTAEQEHLWLLHRTAHEAFYLNHPHAYRLRGVLDVRALERAIDAVVARHENLRTCFPELDGRPRPSVAARLHVPLVLSELGGGAPEEREQRLDAALAADIARSFDVERGPLLRASLYRLHEREHVLLLTVHHILTDRVSYDLIDREWMTCYAAFASGQEPELPELPVQYGDFAAWLAQWMQTRAAAAQAEYWLRELAELPRLELPTDRPRPARRGFRAAQLAWDIPAPAWSALRTMAAAQNVTRFSVLLSLYALLLRRWSGQDDVAVAVPVTIRRHRQTEHLIGYFLNTLVLRLDLSGDPRFDELVQRTQRLWLRALDHADVPFETLLSRLGAERDPSRPPLVDASCTYTNPVDDLGVKLPGLEAHNLDAFHRSGWLDLNLGVADSDHSGEVHFHYLVELFDAATIERLMEQLRGLLHDVLADPTRRLSRLGRLSPTARRQLVEQCHATRRDVIHASLPQAFAEQVRRRADAPALARAAGGFWSYRELDRRSARLAHRLRGLGVGPEARVGVYLERGDETVVALLAILRAGGAYVPLDPGDPPERLAYLLDDSRAAWVLSREHEAHVLPPGRARIVILEQDHDVDRPMDEGVPECGLTRDSLAYVTYTSGSTGRPKGVALSHGNVLRLVYGLTESVRLDHDEVLLHLAPLAFDASTFEIWGALLNGARLALAPPGRAALDDLGAVLRRHGVTTLFLTSALFDQVSADQPECFSGVRQLLTGGDVVSPASVRRAAAHAGRVFNVYGPTENTTFTTCHPVERPDELGARVPIGRPIGNTDTYVLDRDLEPLPVGVVGELYTGGDGLARGYWHAPALTAAAFIPHPFSARPGARLYRTGDLARHLPDGALEFAGRRDTQVKIRGYRVEPGEVEAVLRRQPGVHEAAVLVREDQLGHKRLVAYVVPGPTGGALAPQALLQSLATQLPSYLVPAAVVPLERLPLSPNGKLDRRALPPPPRTSEPQARDAPRTPAETVLCELLSELMGVAADPTDNFFRLGGDSIVALQWAGRARRRGFGFSLRDVFQAPTLAELARRVHALDTPGAPSAGDDDESGPLPPLPIVQWWLERGGPRQAFSQSQTLRVPGGIEAGRLRAALQALLDRHAALRLRLVDGEAERGPWLDIAAPGSLQAGLVLRRVDAQGLSGTELARRAQAELDAARARLDPARGTLLQAVWLDRGAARSGRLALSAHHLAVDAVSWRVLAADLAAAWDAAADGRDVHLAPCPTSLRHWARRLEREAHEPARVAELDYWRAQLEGAHVGPAAGALDPRRDTLGGARELTMRLPAPVTAALLGEAAAVFHAGIDELLLAGLTSALVSVARRHDPDAGAAVLLDVERHGRDGLDALDLSRTVGWLTSLHPLRFDLAGVDIDAARQGGLALGTLIKTVKEHWRRRPDNGLGYGLLRYLNAQTASRLAHLPAPPLSFNYLGRGAAGGRSRGFWEALDDNLGTGAEPDAPLSHALQLVSRTLDTEAGPQLVASWVWAPELVSEDVVQGCAEAWFEALGAIAREVQRAGAGALTSSDLPLVSVTQDELDRLEQEHGRLDDVLPLTPLQEGLLFHAGYNDTDADAYGVQVNLELEGTLDAPRLERAAAALVRRHACLRAAFPEARPGHAVQVQRSAADVEWSREDLSTLDVGQAEARLARLLAEDRGRRFDLARAPLVRFQLVRLPGARARLVLATHHVLLDGWSLQILVQDLLALYRADGDLLRLPPAAAFRDYLAWRAGQDREAAADAWRDALAALPPHAGAVTGRTAALAGAGTTRTCLDLDEHLTRRLVEHTRRLALTLNTLLQGVWAALLARSTGRDDVVFGTTVAGRPPELPGSERMVGLFINTLPVRVRLRRAESLRALLTRVQAQQAQLDPHQYLGLSEIQRLAGGSRLFDSLLVLENFPDTPGDLDAGDELRVVDAETQDGTHYPLSIVAVPGTRLRLRFTGRLDVLDPLEVDGLSARFARLLEAFADDPDARLDELPLPEAERRRVLVEWNLSARERPDQRLVHECVAAQAGSRPRAVAVSCGARELTYAELDARAAGLARRLQRRGVRPETRVGVYTTRDVEWVVAILALWKAGAVYVPLEPGHPAPRARAVAEDAGVELLLSDATLSDGLGWPGPTFTLAGAAASPEPELDLEPASGPLVHPENLAYVMYTSGSTGRPKGVMIEHRGMLNHLWAKVEELELGPRDVVAQNAPASFDISIWQVFAPLLVGGRVHVLDDDDAHDGTRLLDAALRRGVSVLETVPSVLSLMSSVEPPAARPDEARAGLRWLISNAEALPLPVARAWHARHPGTRLMSTYGATECSDDTSHWVFAPSLGPDWTCAPLGRPIGNLEMYVLDDGLRPLPLGAAGELHLGGAGVGRGYHGEPALTAARFVPHPYSALAGARLYRTGDLARRRHDGELEFLGRIDRQVKVRGQRVELGEIETTLLHQPGVSQVLVCLRRRDDARATPGASPTGDAGDAVRLVAYVVPSEAGRGAALEHELREALAARLPDIMQPEAYVTLAAMPLTPNGKIDQQALPPPPAPQGDPERYVAPRNELEQHLCDLWAQALNVERVGIHDNFFRLGGHSLVVLRVIARVRSELRADVPLAALFRCPTVAAFAVPVAQARARPESAPPPIVAVPRRDFKHPQRP